MSLSSSLILRYGLVNQYLKTISKLCSYIIQITLKVNLRGSIVALSPNLFISEGFSSKVVIDSANEILMLKEVGFCLTKWVALIGT